MKEKNDKNFLKLTVGIIAVVSVIGLAFFVLQNKNVKIEKEDANSGISSSTPSKIQEIPIDTENDGIYTDLKYGFTFNYPREIFVSQRQPRTITEHASQMFWYSSERDSNSAFPEKPWIDLRVNHVTMSKERLVTDFNKIYNQSIGKLSSETGATKLRELSINEGKGMVFKIEKKEDADVVPYTYLAAWLRGEDTIWLGLNINDSTTYSNYEKIFNSIVVSFTFTDKK